MASNNIAENATRFCNGFSAEASFDDKQDFAVYPLNNYLAQDGKTATLSKYFADEFPTFSDEDFTALNLVTRRKLRDHPRKLGVFVPKKQNVWIPSSLYSVVHKYIFGSENDFDRLKASAENISNETIIMDEFPTAGNQPIEAFRCNNIQASRDPLADEIRKTFDDAKS